MSDVNLNYGPIRPEPDVGYQKVKNKTYLKGYAQKILKDLIRVARMYSGLEVKLYAVSKTERCPVCTNNATGERLITNCKVCHGTGRKDGWEYLGDFWTYTDFGPAYHMESQIGNTENPNGTKAPIIILGAPILEDQALIIFKEPKEVYKIYDIEPHIVAMRGDVIAQIAQTTRLTPGSEEYKLIDW